MRFHGYIPLHSAPYSECQYEWCADARAALEDVGAMVAVLGEVKRVIHASLCEQYPKAPCAKGCQQVSAAADKFQVTT